MPDIPTLYEDSDMIIVNKPAGIPSHAGPKGGDNIESLMRARFDPRRRPVHLAHRLDRDTSGCLILGKTQPALRRIGHLFASRQVVKTYLAITCGVPKNDEFMIDAPLSKRTKDARSWWMEVNMTDGQEAKTMVRILAAHEDHAVVECRPLTGRTHQIRVHLAHIGCPIQSDPVYGDAQTRDDTAPFCLHAAGLFLPFDSSNPLHINAPIPQAFHEALDRYKLCLS